MKFQLILSFLSLGGVSAFCPSTLQKSVTFVQPSTSLSLADESPEPAAPAAPAAPKAAPAPKKEAGGALVPVNQETVEFTAGILGAVAGFSIGGPFLAAIGAAAANYASKSDKEVGEVLSAVSKTSIEIWNYFNKLDQKYELLDGAKNTLSNTLDKIKSSGKTDPEVIEKVEKALASTTSKIKEINEEYDLVGATTTALGAAGELVERAVAKAGELNEDYKLSDRALDSLKKGVDMAKEKAVKA